MMKLLVKNIGQLVTVVEGGEVCLAGKGMAQIKVGQRVLLIQGIVNADFADHDGQFDQDGTLLKFLLIMVIRV